MSCSSEEGVQIRRRRHRTGTVLPLDSPIEAGSHRALPQPRLVAGAGAAGFFTALVAARAGAAVAARVELAVERVGQLSGPGRPGGRARPDDSAGSTCRTRSWPGGAPARESRRAHPLRGGAGPRARAVERACVSTRARSLALGLEGGHSPPARRPRRWKRAPGAGLQASCRRRRSRTSGSRCTSAARARACGSRAAAASALLTRRRRQCPAAATVLATGGAAALWLRTTNPRGAIGSGLLLAHEAGAVLADLELLQFHPTALVARRPARRLPRHRGRPRAKARPCSTRDGERFVDELAPRDEVARAMHGPSWNAAGATAVVLDMRGVERSRFPNIVAALAEAGHRSKRVSSMPVAPAAHYTIGGIVHGQRWALEPARPLRGWRVRLHRRPRREPARLELAVRMLRVRAPGGARRRAEPGASPRRARHRPPSPSARPSPRRSDASALWRLRRHRADRRGLRCCSTTRPSARAAHRSLRAAPRGEPWLPPARGLPASRGPRSRPRPSRRWTPAPRSLASRAGTTAPPGRLIQP